MPFSHYTEPRATKDLDLFIDPSAENARIVFAALAEFGAPLAGVAPSDFQQPDTIFQTNVPPSRIDILKDIDGVIYANKLAVGRLRDLADVEDLRAALKATSTQQKPEDD